MVEITDGDYRAYINNENILIQHTQYEKILCIEKESINISECESEVIRNLKKTQMHKPHAILGLIQIENLNFIVFVKSAYFIGKIEEAEIFRVKETEIIPLVHYNKIENISSEIKSQVVGIKNLLTLGFFYSFNYDLTNSTQKQAKLKSMDILSTANKKFFWNYCMYKRFFAPNNNNVNGNNNNVKSLSYNNFGGQGNLINSNNNLNGFNNRGYNSAHKTRSSKDLMSFPNFEDFNNKKFKNVNDPLNSSGNNYFNNSKNISSNNNFGNNNNNINFNNSNNFFRNDDTNIMNSSNNANYLFGANNNNNNNNIYPNINSLNKDLTNLSISNKNNDNNDDNNQSSNFNNINTSSNSNNTNINPFNPKVNKIWMVVCIYGHVGISSTKLNQINKLHFYLISRRSVYHAGTRYLTRGLDDLGHVANFVETEQIIRLENNLFSFLQFRGSVPIFFEQPGVTAQTKITRSPELTAPAFKKHIEELKEDFNFIYMVNLMNVNKPNEHVITQNFENQIKINEVKNCKYLFWDFQNQCKYDNYENLDNFVANLESVFKIFKYYHEDSLMGQRLKEQTGIIRTNCLDCLDRTNVIQARVAWKVLEAQLNFLQIKNVSEIFSGGFINANNNKKHPLLESFKDIWSENGDSISFQYAGTASCITSVTKNGKHGFFGLFQHGLVSITRFYQGNFEDGFKQKCIDTMLQKNVKKKKDDPYHDFFNHNCHISSNNNMNTNNNISSLSASTQNKNTTLNNNTALLQSGTNSFNNQNSQKNSFNNNKSNQNNFSAASAAAFNTQFQNPTGSILNNNNNNNQKPANNTFKISDLNIFIGSWNVAGKDFPENFSLIQWLFPKENMQLPDLYVIGFQEICNLNAKNIVISSNTHKVDNWKNIVSYNLNQLGKYALVKCLDLVGLFVLVFVKDEFCEFIRNIETASLRTGLYGTLGNKGSCLIRFEFDEVSLVFCCSHLKAGSSHANSRTSEISEILNKNFALKNYKEMKFNEHDVQFIFGDLNFRIDLDLNNCLEFIKSGYLETLFLYDQLYTKKSLNLELMQLQELPVKFPPTYKYLINSNDYDFKKKRIPSWCDRILFNGNGKVKGLEYNHVEMFRESDHKPIFGIYKVKLREEDLEDKEQKLIVKVKVGGSGCNNFGNNNNSGNLKVNVAVGNYNNNNNFANGKNVGNNGVPFAPGNNINNDVSDFFSNQIFADAVQNQFVNHSQNQNQNQNLINSQNASNVNWNFNNVNAYNPYMQSNPYMNNNFRNNGNLNKMIQANNLINNGSSANDKNVFEGIFDQYKINPPTNNPNSNFPPQNINSSSNNFYNNSNFFKNTINQPNYQMNNLNSNNNNNKDNFNPANNHNNHDYLNFQINENKNNNNNSQRSNINSDSFQTNNNNDFFDNYQKQNKKDNTKTNLLRAASNKQEERSALYNNNNKISNNYPVFGDDFSVESDKNYNIVFNQNIKNFNNELNFNNRNIRK